MKIILQQPVDKLGEPGDIIEVKDGYARNFLLPRGLAIAASKGAAANAERVRTAHEAKVARARDEADAMAARISKTPIQISAQAGEEGKLFGSVTAQEIAETLSRSLGEEIDKRIVRLAEPIRSTGTHEVQVHLHPEVNAALTVQVVAQ